jgi:hypothetical protein
MIFVESSCVQKICENCDFFERETQMFGSCAYTHKPTEFEATCAYHSFAWGDVPTIVSGEKREWKFKIGDWDDIRSFDEICKKSKFTYFWCYEKDGRLAPGDNGKPHIVLEDSDKFLTGVTIETNGGLAVDAEFSAGKEFIREVSKDFEMYLSKDAKKAIAAYLIKSNSEEFILEIGDD